jgi:heme/copper-type cytochrome/quinol oxidase subunit 4
MKDTITSSFILLLTLTLLAAFAASNVSPEIIVTTVVALAFIKFWLVAFQFMELKKAHPFWKYLIIGFGGLMVLHIVLTIQDVMLH